MGLPETSTREKSEYSNYSQPNFGTSSRNTSAWNPKPETPTAPVAPAERVVRGNSQNLISPAPSPTPNTTQKRKRRKSPLPASREYAGANNHRASPQRRRSFASTPEAKLRLVWTVFGSLAGIVIFWLVASSALGMLKNLFSPLPALQGPQLTVQINEPPVAIPDPNSNPAYPQGTLTKATAEDVIRTWLSAKALVSGPNYDVSTLDKILVGSALSDRRGNVQRDKTDKRYWKYQHPEMEVESIEASSRDPNNAAVQATVSEVAEVYENEKLNTRKSYSEKVRVRYDLVRQDGVWRIRSMSVLNKI
jgi:hypothetical protein